MKRWAMNLVIVCLVGTVGASLAAEGHGGHEKETEKAKSTPQTTCPVTGDKIDKGLYVDHEGRRVYVCCKKCVDTVKKDPQKYIKKLEAGGVVLDAAAKPAKPAKRESGHDGHRGHNH